MRATTPNPDIPPAALSGGKEGPRGFSRWLPDATLLLVTVIWGTTFLVTQVGLQSSGPFGFLVLRFTVAALVLTGFSLPLLKGLTRTELRAGVLTGLAMTGVFVFQTIGLQSIDSSKSAFLTALYVPLVPLLELLLFRRRLPSAVWLGVLLAFIGLVLLSGPGATSLALGRGEIFTLLCALILAGQILLIAKVAPGTDARRLSIVQLVVAALSCLICMGLFKEPAPRPTAGFLGATIGLGLASAFIQVATNWAQKVITASRVTVIYSLETVWAGVFGRMAGERLTGLDVTGAGLILVSVLISRLPELRHAVSQEQAES